MTPEQYMQIITCKDKTYTLKKVRELMENIGKAKELEHKKLALYDELLQAVRTHTEGGETIGDDGQPLELNKKEFRQLAIGLRSYGIDLLREQRRR